MRTGAHLQQEGDIAHQVIRVTVDGELLAVHVLVRISHGVHGAAALVLQGCRHFLAEQLGHLHDEIIGLGDTHRHRHAHMLAGVVVLDPAEGLGCGIGADGNGGLAVDRIGGVLQLGSAGVDVIAAVAG